MTIVTTASKVTLNGNGVTAAFPYSFEIPGDTSTDQTNVIVTITETATGGQTVLTNNLYSITGINGPAGGEVTYPLSGIPLAAGYTITIQRNVPYIQTTDIPNQSAFFGTVLTAAYDYAMMCIQQIVTSLAYTLKFPVTDAALPNTLPPAAARANGYLGFDDVGQPTIFGIPSSGGGGTGSSWNYRNIFAAGVTHVLANDGALFCNASLGEQTIALPDAVDYGGRLFTFKKVDSSVNAVIVVSFGGNIDGYANFILAQENNAVGVMSNGIDWKILFQL